MSSPRAETSAQGAAGARPALRMEGVAKSFGAAIALEETWLQVERGEFLTLLGPSGCGKTTLLNLTAGFLEADRGEILIGDEPVTETPAWRRQIGIVFQNYALFPHMNVERNVGYGLRMRGVKRPEAAERVRQALALVKLSGLEERRPRQLSGGQQQRVALARAIVIRPRILLLDEPFSALDKNLRGAMQVELKEIQRQLGVTTVFVTHDQGEALSLSDRIVVMSRGRIRQIGTPDDIYRRPADRFVAAFVGDVNVVPARIAGRDGARARVAVGPLVREVDAATLGALGPGEAADLFVRPDRLRLARPGEADALPGRVAALVYGGGHVDVHVDVHVEGAGGPARIVARVPGHEAMTGHPVGSAVAIALPTGDLAAFPPEAIG